MNSSFTKEYIVLLDKKRTMEKELLTLPKGYISKKNIKGNVQYYLQRREKSKIVSSYIRNNEVEKLYAQIERRKTIATELPLINKRLKQLEEAAKLIDNNLLCQMILHKLSVGMDELNTAEKEKCTSFGNAMNSIEGIPVSKDTESMLNDWKNNNVSFLSVFENTLKKYGFPVEKI